MPAYTNRKWVVSLELNLIQLIPPATIASNWQNYARSLLVQWCNADLMMCTLILCWIFATGEVHEPGSLLEVQSRQATVIVLCELWTTLSATLAKRHERNSQDRKSCSLTTQPPHDTNSHQNSDTTWSLAPVRLIDQSQFIQTRKHTTHWSLVNQSINFMCSYPRAYSREHIHSFV